MKQTYQDTANNVYIEAGELNIGSNLKLGKDIDIRVRGKLQIGDNCIIGDRLKANAEELIIGDYFFNLPTDSRGMTIGGGGSNFPWAKLHIGDKLVCHTGHINLAKPITIGNDVGLSHDVDLITHGFWGSVLDGYPRSFEGIEIGNNVIVGWKTIIMSGVKLVNNIVIGSHATVTKSLLTEHAIYVGTPAKLVKMIEEPTLTEKIVILNNIIAEFKELISYYDIPDVNIHVEYPSVQINELFIDVSDLTYTGTHDTVSDAFRDFIRRYGIKVFAPHGFLFKLKRKEI